MKQLKFYQSVLGVVAATLFLLLVPIVAMQLTDEVVWTTSDFIIAGLLFFIVGISYVLITRSATNIIYRLAVALALGTTLFMIWANLAVGLIGAGPNPGNLMYTGVVAVIVSGAIRSHLRASGMERVMYVTALALALVTAIALLANMHHYPGSSAMEIIGVNTFFAAPFIVSGLLFHYTARKQSSATQ